MCILLCVGIDRILCVVCALLSDPMVCVLLALLSVTVCLCTVLFVDCERTVFVLFAAMSDRRI